MWNKELHLKQREDAILLLISIGCKDLTKQFHPKKRDKKFFRYYISKSSHMSFDFDYPEYEEIKVYANRRHIQTDVLFRDLPIFLKQQGII